MTWRPRQDDRLAGHAPRQLGKGDHGAREGDGADGDAERHLDKARRGDVAGRADVEGFRRIERAGGHEHRRQADKRVEGRHQLRHRGHGDAPGDVGADRAADAKTQDDQECGETRPRLTQLRQGGGDGNRHAGHAVEVAAPRAFRARQTAQRQDEQHAGGQIEQRDDVWGHGRCRGQTPDLDVGVGSSGVRPLTSVFEFRCTDVVRGLTPSRLTPSPALAER